MSNFNSISTSELEMLISNPTTKIIDVRAIEYYNGWKKFDEKRGGHIKNAKTMPIKWIDYLDWIEIVKNKNIKVNDKIVIYSYTTEDSNRVAERFSDEGYGNVLIYEHFLDEWVQNESLPMEKLARYNHLVSAEWLKQLISTGMAPEYNNNKYVICHGHYQNPHDYEIGHIPGAISVDSNSLESQITWNRRSPEELKQVLEEYGITSDTTVIFYGRFSFPNNDDPFPGSSAGHLGSIRCAFIMLYAGVNDVRILNGGLQSWEDAGYEITKEIFNPTPEKDFGAQIPANPYYAVDIPEAKQILADPQHANLVCVRSWPEYIGEVSGYNYIKKKGRIPGAVFGNCGTDAYHMENYRNLDHTMREYHEVEDLWKEVGITADKHNAYYCGTGWRGSEAFFNAWLMGWPKVAVFDDGWFGWSNDDSNSIETGEPTNKNLMKDRKVDQ